VLHFVVAAELRVFILERVVTMWARCHDLLHLAAGARANCPRRRGSPPRSYEQCRWRSWAFTLPSPTLPSVFIDRRRHAATWGSTVQRRPAVVHLTFTFGQPGVHQTSLASPSIDNHDRRDAACARRGHGSASRRECSLSL
jgi:hypothetical protein